MFAGGVVKVVHGRLMKFFGLLSAAVILSLIVHLFYSYWYVLSTSVILLLLPVLLGALFTTVVFRLSDMNKTLIRIQLVTYISMALAASIIHSFILPMARGDAGALFINIILTVLVLSVFGLLWQYQKVSEMEFSSAYGLLGALFGGIEGLIVGLIIALICGFFGASLSVIYMVIAIPTVLATFFGFFWNGFEDSREEFSLPFAAWGMLRGTVIFIPSVFSGMSTVETGCCLLSIPITILNLAWRIAAIPFVVIGGIFYGFVCCGLEQDFDLEW